MRELCETTTSSPVDSDLFVASIEYVTSLDPSLTAGGLGIGALAAAAPDGSDRSPRLVSARASDKPTHAGEKQQQV
jgi:hypothetical protein